MPVQTITHEITTIVFDREKSINYKTEYNSPCSCQECRNYNENIKTNPELISFLSNFGVDYNRPEEVFSCDIDEDADSPINSTAYYGVFGKIQDDEVHIQKFGVSISFEKGSFVPNDREDECFWIVVEGNFRYVLDEERETSISMPSPSLLQRVKARIKCFFGDEQ